MLKLSKKVDYGLVLLSGLRATPEPCSAREIAERGRLPLAMVANILKDLTAAGILTSTRGAQGGYEMAREAAEISLADVVQALEGPINLVECASSASSCRLMDLCPTQDPIQAVHRKFEEFMSGFTLDQILRPIPQLPSTATLLPGRLA